MLSREKGSVLWYYISKACVLFLFIWVEKEASEQIA